MQIAVDVAGFSAAEADELRRAMGAKRSTEKMERLRGRFFAGMAGQRDHRRAGRRRSSSRMLAFANFGFPESHSISFASLVYYSAWFKRYYPAAFCAALLNAQPMGFYSPQSLVADARRHGVLVRGPDVNLGRAEAVLQPDPASDGRAGDPAGAGRGAHDRRELAEEIDAERERAGPYRDLADLARRVRLTVPQAEALATAGAFGCFGVGPPLGAVGGRGGGGGAPGPAAGHRRRAGRPGAARDERRRAHRRRRLGHRRVPGQPPDRAPAGAADGLGAVRIDRLDAVGRGPAGDPSSARPGCSSAGW